jgi:hypothetical protein
VAYLQRTFGNRAVQRVFAPPAPESSQDLGERIRSAGGGRPLEGNVQRALEEHLGADLSGVRLHVDSTADALARQVNASAFTSGSDIFFKAGAYNPASAAGRHTLAHEAAHVVQQAAGPVSGTPVEGGVSISSPDDTFERAADAAASAVEFS